MTFKYKLGFGPMSDEIVECLISYSLRHKYPLMIIASRNQVDYRDGYSATTASLSKKIKDSTADILICRDHCGPFFKDTDRGLSLGDALERTKLTIECDLENGFDLIHIDISRIQADQLSIASELFDFILLKNPEVRIEFGSEDNLGENLDESRARAVEQLAFLQNYRKNVVFYTTQTGSLVKHTQVGSFDTDQNRRLADIVHDRGFLVKEHNADYLNLGELKKRVGAGIDALNIAPQLGYIQTSILKDLASNAKAIKEWEAFSEIVYRSRMWTRWVPNNIDDRSISVLVSGHYFFKTDAYKRLLDKISVDEYASIIEKEVDQILDLYRRGLNDIY